MNTPETKLTDSEQEHLVFIVGTVAARLTKEEQEQLAQSIERFARMVASRVYLIAENDGMKKAFRDQDKASSSD